MPRFEKHHHNNKFDRRPPPPAQSEPQVEDEEDVKWSPTPEVFEAFLVRDAELCAGNLRHVMSARNAPMSLKEIKDSTLHSSGTVELQVTSWLQAGVVQEAKGKYSLAPVRR